MTDGTDAADARIGSTVGRLRHALELLIVTLRDLETWPAEGAPFDASGAHVRADTLLEIARGVLQESRLGQRAPGTARNGPFTSRRRESQSESEEGPRRLTLSEKDDLLLRSRQEPDPEALEAHRALLEARMKALRERGLIK